MPPDTQTAPTSKAMVWGGWIMGILPVLLLLMSGVMKVSKAPVVLEGFKQMGYPESIILGLGIVELVCTVIYLIPRTCVLGAILPTGYLGGAVATHVRVEEMSSAIMPIIMGMVLWGGLWLRDARVRALAPWRS